MTQIRSTWTLSSAPPLTGLLSAAEWSQAARMAIPHGTMLVQNDATHLFIGLDITAETGVANPNDYFWFIVDMNENGKIDANRDKLFGQLPGNQNRLVMAYMIAPDETTGIPAGQVIPSQLKSGFGPSLLSPAPHRQWQISFALSDLDVTIDPIGPAPTIDFGLRIATIGGFVGELPANPLGDFSHFNSIRLATLISGTPPHASVGPVIAAVGLVGTGDIAADGYATITAPYYLNPNKSAFCGTLNLIGNETILQSLWAAGATKYLVQHRYGSNAAAANAAAWSPILQVWSNFEVVGVNDVWQSFAPDATGHYPMVNPSLAYTIQNLLFQWATANEPDGIHQFELQFFNAANAPVPTTPQVLTLALDNQPPIVQLIDILHAGTPVSPCAIVNLASITDGIQLQYEAYDPEGDLLSISLTAEYGAGQSATIYSDSYSAHASSSHIWQGVTSDTRPASPAVWVPPYTCAYLFEVTAYKRTTNGYSYPIIYGQTFQTVTLIKPGVVLKPVVLDLTATHVAATGFDKLPATGDIAKLTTKATATN